MTTFTQTLTFTTATCYKCGVEFGMPAELHLGFRDNGGTFYCPNGHGQAYTNTTISTLEKEIERQKANVTWYREQSEARGRERDRAAHQTRAYKGVITKVKKRISNGVCPCCNRTFSDLARHMQSQHPTYADESGK